MSSSEIDQLRAALENGDGSKLPPDFSDWVKPFQSDQEPLVAGDIDALKQRRAAVLREREQRLSQDARERAEITQLDQQIAQGEYQRARQAWDQDRHEIAAALEPNRAAVADLEQAANKVIALIKTELTPVVLRVNQTFVEQQRQRRGAIIRIQQAHSQHRLRSLAPDQQRDQGFKIQGELDLFLRQLGSGVTAFMALADLVAGAPENSPDRKLLAGLCYALFGNEPSAIRQDWNAVINRDRDGRNMDNLLKGNIVVGQPADDKFPYVHP